MPTGDRHLRPSPYRPDLTDSLPTYASERRLPACHAFFCYLPNATRVPPRTDAYRCMCVVMLYALQRWHAGMRRHAYNNCQVRCLQCNKWFLLP